MTITVTQGDCIEVLREREGALFDACVTDPPYHLTSIVKRFGADGAAPVKVGSTGAYARASRGFMGQMWDGGDVALRPETWRAVYDHMKPGAHLVAFSGTRTYHRMACAIEDAGFEIRDQLGWAFGQGFPKSHDVGGGWGTALKPAWEPICLARKPIAESTVAANMLVHGTGGLNIDACRVEGEVNNGQPYVYFGHNGNSLGAASERLRRDGGGAGSPLGRFPANLLHDGGEEVEALFPDDKGRPGNGPRTRPQSRAPSQVGFAKPKGANSTHHDDDGSCARFFYSAKAGPLDRLGSAHPTVKPVDLMRWLCRLVTPAGGLILDPFAGSGTTGIAAMAEGFSAELIDLEPAHVADINRKLASLRGEGARVMEQHVKRKAARVKREPSPLFGDAA